MGDVSTQIIFAAVSIVVSGIVGLLVGFFLGAQYGSMSGELRILKAIKSDRSRKSRSRNDFEREMAG